MAEASTSPDCLGVLLLGRTGQGKSTTANKLLDAGGKSVLPAKRFDPGEGPDSCTTEIRSIFRDGTEKAKAVQVVDTPGFADSKAREIAGVKMANLAMFRDLVRKRVSDKLRIHRVLYFLPQRGALERADAVLQEEIEVMHHYFGNAIFERMVLVATLHKRYQRFGFSDEDKEDIRKTFETALKCSSIGENCPKCPPVIFIGTNDTGVDIQNKIQNATVSYEVLTLDKFVLGTCAKCSTKYIYHEDDDPNKPENRIERSATKQEEQKDSKEAFTPYDYSQCHPLFIPKYSYWKRAAGGAAHVATLGIPMLIQKLRNHKRPWPTFTSNDEMCINCEQGPGSKGCCKIGTDYKATLPTGVTKTVPVKHNNQSDHDYSKILEFSEI